MTLAARPPVRIGVVGNDVPRQLVSACGAVPLRLVGSWVPEAVAELPTDLGAVDFVVADLFRTLTGPGADTPHGVIVCNDSQAHLRLFYLLRARGHGIPVHLLDLPRQDSAASRVFATQQVHALIAFCAALTGAPPTQDTLVKAATDEIRLGAALERMRSRRRAGVCSGGDALTAYRVASRLTVDEALPMVDELHGPATDTGIRVHVSGSTHPDATVYRLLESRGLRIVSDDHDTGDRGNLGVGVVSPEVDVVIEGLTAAHLGRIGSTSVELAQARAELTASMAANAGADVVVSMIRSSDEAALWDVPDLRECLHEIGVPLHVVSHLEPHNVVERIHELADSVVAEGVRTP